MTDPAPKGHAIPSMSEARAPSSGAPSASLCPGCGKAIDPLRAGQVAIVDGRFEIDDGERVAVLTADTPGEDLPPHLRGRVEQAPGAEMASSQAAHDAKGRDDSSDAAGETTCSSCGAGISQDDQFCGECGSRVELSEQFRSDERGMHPPTGASDDDAAAPDSTEPGPPAGGSPTCPKCHAAVAADDRFCGECGTKLRAASVSPSPPEPAA